MIVKIEVDELLENEIVIKIKELNSTSNAIIELIENYLKKQTKLECFDNNKVIYLYLDEIIFFETEYTAVYAHTPDKSFRVRLKLYELEEILPLHFQRISKSTIINIMKISSIEKTFTSNYLVNFESSSKTTYISRRYYKNLKCKLKEIHS